MGWSLTGEHNVRNACAAVLAARHVGVKPMVAAEALSRFESVKRRMELLAALDDGQVFDDFAHHPTAIASTLEGLKQRVDREGGRVIAVIEPRSNTMKMGVHQDHLMASAQAADKAYWFEATPMGWPLKTLAEQAHDHWFDNGDALIDALFQDWQPGDRVVFMSNGGFSGIPHRFAALLMQRSQENV